jgi:hypothetical protein
MITAASAARRPPPRPPVALLVASGRARAVTRRLQAAAGLCAARRTVQILVATPARNRDLAAALRRPGTDLVIFDGHGYLPPRIGTLPLAARAVRDPDGRGITAPVLVLGAGGGASTPFLTALRGCLDAPQTVFLGRAGWAGDGHGELLYPAVVDLLARFGPAPAPAGFHAALAALLGQLGDPARSWTTRLLTPQPGPLCPRATTPPPAPPVSCPRGCRATAR